MIYETDRKFITCLKHLSLIDLCFAGFLIHPKFPWKSAAVSSARLRSSFSSLLRRSARSTSIETSWRCLAKPLRCAQTSTRRHCGWRTMENVGKICCEQWWNIHGLDDMFYLFWYEIMIYCRSDSRFSRWLTWTCWNLDISQCLYWLGYPLGCDPPDTAPTWLALHGRTPVEFLRDLGLKIGYLVMSTVCKLENIPFIYKNYSWFTVNYDGDFSWLCPKNVSLLEATPWHHPKLTAPQGWKLGSSHSASCLRSSSARSFAFDGNSMETRWVSFNMFHQGWGSGIPVFFLSSTSGSMLFIVWGVWKKNLAGSTRKRCLTTVLLKLWLGKSVFGGNPDQN